MTSEAESGTWTTVSSTWSSTFRITGLSKRAANIWFRRPRKVVVISAGRTSRRLQAESLTWISRSVDTGCSAISASAETLSQRSTDSTIAATL